MIEPVLFALSSSLKWQIVTKCGVLVISCVEMNIAVLAVRSEFIASGHTTATVTLAVRRLNIESRVIQ